MRRLNIIWMFLGGLAVAFALVVVRPGAEPPATARPESRVVRASDPAPSAAPPSADERSEARTGEPARLEGTGRDAPEPAPAGPDRDADSLTAELLAMSEGYRNRVFLQAIREVGHVCDAVVDTRLGNEDVVVWRVACGHGNAFLIGVGSGRLEIEPLYYGDPGVGPAPVPLRRDVPIE